MEDDMISRAALYSRAAHQAVGQRRKYTGEHYYHHPKAVADMVSTAVGVTPEMVAAAYLHDVVEDTAITDDDIARDFGLVVAGYVFDLTDQFTDPAIGNREYRKAMERDRLARANPNSQTIKYADLIDNTASIAKHDPDFAKVYLREKRSLLESMASGDDRLRDMAWQVLLEAEKACTRTPQRLVYPYTPG